MRLTQWPAAFLCGIALALPLSAQEEPVPAEPPPPPPTETKPVVSETAKTPKETEPALHRWGGWTLSVAAWEPALVGADEEIAWTNHGGTAVPLMAGSSARIRETAEITYHLPRDSGAIVGHFDSMYQRDLVENFTPGQFNFVESRGFPFALGAFDDGLADGVRSNSTRKTREFRLEFAKRAFDSRWARGSIKAGYRQVSHARDIAITSFAIVPNLPPAIPPAVDDPEEIVRLAPLPDLVSQKSKFFGHGVGAALDVDFPLHPRFSIVSGISIGLIRGTTDSSYESTSHYYYLNGSPDVPLTKAQLFALLSNPPIPPAPGPYPSDINQAVVFVGVSQDSSSQLAVTFDAYIGVEGTVYRGLKLFARLRDMYYMNVGEYVVPTAGVANQRTSLNAGYDGYSAGLSWRF